MANVGTIWSALKLNINDFSTKLNSAAGQLKAFSKTVNGQTNNAAAAVKALQKGTEAYGLTVKSVSRIVSGIVISQVFYRGVQSIREAERAVWDFSSALEYAKIAYTNLFDDSSLADEFINVLKDFAALSPFDFKESEAAAKRLLAYGVEYKNVMYVMQGVMSAAAMQGDSTKVESISRALGQIYTKGRLMNEEMRQLAEAGIPAYEILREKLGLTQEQLQNLGNESIPASEAINALVDGMTERFGNVTTAATKTMTGIISNIRDNATMLASGLFEPVYVKIKSVANALGELLFKLRDIYELKGAGGVLEALVPKELLSTIRLFIANVINLGHSIGNVAQAIFAVLKPAIMGLVLAFNAVTPVITTIVNALSAMIYIIASNEKVMKALAMAVAAATAMWVAYKVKLIAAALASKVISGMALAVKGLSTALSFLLAHPIWAFLLLFVGVVTALTGTFGKLSDSIRKFFADITKLNGIDPDKLLLPSQKERANDLDKFNKKLDGTADAMDDLADSTGKAVKAAKGLLSFDEVFKLNQPDEGTDSGIDSIDLSDLDFSGLDFSSDAYMPDVPDFTGWTNAFVDKFREAWENNKELMGKIISTALGSAFGGLIGGLIGGKVGGVIGMLAGALVGYFWNELADHFGLEPDQKVRAGIIGGIGAGIGAIIGGAFGGVLGAKIGAAVGGIVGGLWGIIAEAMGVVPEQHLATGVGGLVTGLTLFFRKFALSVAKSFSAGLIPTYIDDAFVGFSKAVNFSVAGALKAGLKSGLKSGVIGLITGVFTGILSNALTAWIADELGLVEKDLENAATGQMIGSLIGTVVGMFFGPIGSIIGGSLGQLAGSVLGEFWDYMSTTIKGTVIGGSAGLPIGTLIGAIVGSLGGPIGTAAGAAIGTAVGVILGTVSGAIVEHWDAIKSFFSGVGEAIDGMFSGIVDAITTAADNIGGFFSWMSEAFSGITSALGGIWESISTVWNNVASVVTTVMSDVWSAVSTVWNDVWSAISTVCDAVWGVVEEIWWLIHDIIVKVLSDIWTSISTTFSGIYEVVAERAQAVWTVISSSFNAIYTVVAGVVNAVLNVIKGVFNVIYTYIAEKVSGVVNVVKTAFTAVYTVVSDKVTKVLTIAKTVFTAMQTIITEKVNKIKTDVVNVFTIVYNSVKTSIANMYDTVKTGISAIYTTFTDWIKNMWDNVFGKFFGWIGDGIEKLREFFGLESRAEESRLTKYSDSSTASATSYGHATGGIFNREHVARFAEGDKAEAIIPLENNSAMQPFVDAVANGLTATLAPMLATASGPQMQPLYVGTLIADDRSLKELERKMKVIRLQEERR